MEIRNLSLTDLKITSLELVEQINIFRKHEERSELRHDTLLSIIRDEFEEEIDLQYILEIKYLDSKNRSYPMFSLTTDQARQILMRESKGVRKQVIAYTRSLEEKLKLLTAKDVSKKLQLEAMESLQHMLPVIEQAEAINFIKANTLVNKLVSDLFGFPRMLKKSEMNKEMITTRDLVMTDYVKLYEFADDNEAIKEMLKRKYIYNAIEKK
ncbi:MAG: hypothetical protein ACRC6U_10035 [Fusobacteriaceae bacterium]